MQRKYPGIFITFEGGEGAGKTTQIKLLKERLEQEGHQVIVTREPGGTSISDQIRAVLLDSANAAMCIQAEFLLYMAARAQHIQELVVPAITKGYVVLCDRFVDSTIAYQHYARHAVDKQRIEELSTYIAGDSELFWPDLTILLEVDVEVGLKRSLKRVQTLSAESGKDEMRFELESIEFHKRVNQGYRSISEEHPDRVKVVDATTLQLEEIAQRIYSLVTDNIRS